MKYRFKDKVIIITGASSGIGKSCVYQCIKKGAKVVLVSRDREKLEQIQFDLKEFGSNLIIKPIDVTKRENVEAMIQEVIDCYKKVDILINSAGVGICGSAISTPLEYFREALGVNLFAILYCIRGVYPYMKEQGGGIIVNISSIAGLKGFYNSGLYSASKFAVTGLTESLSMEGQKHNIKFILVCPGKTETNFDDNLLFDENKFISKRKGIKAEFVAKAILSAIKRNRKLVVVGRGCRLLYILNRLSPSLTNSLLKWMYR